MTFNGIKATAAAAAVLITASLAGQALAQSGQGGYQQAPGYQQGQGGYDRQDSGQGGPGGYDHGDRGGYDHGDRGGDYGRGDQGPGGYDRDFGDRNFNDREFDQRGRFYYGGETGQRLEKIEQWARFGVRSGRLNRWEAHRVFEMLRSIKRQAYAARRDGFVSPRERMVLNERIDATVRFMRNHMNPGPYDGGRRY